MHQPLKSVERLFPFAVRSHIVVPGRDAMSWKRRKLLFVLITTDLTPKSRDQIQRDFAPLPIVERYTSLDIQVLFNYYGAKVLGFLNCPLARTILNEMKEFRLVAAPATPASVLALKPVVSTAQLKVSVAQPDARASQLEAVPPALASPPPPCAELAPKVTSAPESRMGWRTRRKQQKDERLAEKLRRKKTPQRRPKPKAKGQSQSKGTVSQGSRANVSDAQQLLSADLQPGRNGSPTQSAGPEASAPPGRSFA